MRKIYHIVLDVEEKNKLLAVINDSSSHARTIKRANILLALDENAEYKLIHQKIADTYHVARGTVTKIINEYCTKGLEYALSYKRNSNSSNSRRKMTGDIEAALIQIACGEVPQGHSRWSVVMLTQKLIELRIVEDISDETVRLTLKKMNLNLT